MNISRPNMSNVSEAYVDPVNGLRGRVMTARSATDVTQAPQVELAGPETQEVLGPGAIRSAVDNANTMMKRMNVGIEFSFDEEAGEMVIKVIDAETRDILRQFPSEEMMALSRAMERMQAALISQTA